MMRIRILIPYFGRWPHWMPFFVASCRANPDIDWLLFSDCGELPGAPDNLEVRAISFADYCQQAGAKLEIAFAPESPYKLCDLKPALGFIHADELEGYDFWGFSDIDLVYGQLRRYFTDQRLARYELLSTHERRVSGHFCLLRNNARMREAFRSVEGWRRLLANPRHQAFDEVAFSRLFIRRKNWPAGLRRLLDAANPWRRRSEFAEAYSTPNGRIAWVDGSFDFPQRWFWDNGVMRTDRGDEREFPYFHFIAWKTGWHAALPEQGADWALGSRWSISATGFHKD
ncbi:hypothetical protein P8H27_05900 [Pseudomonas sp. sp1636]|uniref:DUF6625 family protein n=1 Tax=Pseudomonas sp. sp1636 TaxID=3036707 RepID=UPI0025A67AA7|nr:DUF6625 family protein [Pseudomonas sp. sp1636]MDM8348427.1 hypothetical protein [Pseudomonas sp. sp1636]